jgi:hypothetical protein
LINAYIADSHNSRNLLKLIGFHGFLAQKLISNILSFKVEVPFLGSEIFAFLTPKSIFFLTTCKILNRWIYNTTIFILGPKFRFCALKAYFNLFDPKKYIFFSTQCKIPNRWIYTTTMLLGPKFRFWALKAVFRLLDPSKVYFFLLHVKFPNEVPFLGSEIFWPPKVYFFLLHVKFWIDGYITRPYWFWAPNSVSGGQIFFIENTRTALRKLKFKNLILLASN